MRKKPMLAYPVSDKPIDYTKPVIIKLIQKFVHNNLD